MKISGSLFQHANIVVPFGTEVSRCRRRVFQFVDLKCVFIYNVKCLNWLFDVSHITPLLLSAMTLIRFILQLKTHLPSKLKRDSLQYFS